MSGNERLKGIQVHRPIIYGSHARLLTDEEKLTAPAGHTHRWTIFFTSAATPPPEPKASGTSSTDPPPIDLDYIPGGADDMSYLIKRVVFRLHETYPNPNRMCERPPYRVTETGWGEFTVQIKVTFVPEAGEKALSLQHAIKLHHWGEPIEPLPPAPSMGDQEQTPASTPGVGGDQENTQVKMEAGETPAAPTTADTPAAESASATGAAGNDSPVPSSIATPAASASASASAPATGTPAGTTALVPATAAGVPASLPTVAATYPVHAWQYDELVFCDPPAHFMAIMDEHAPTPLPTRNRRPRDQREEYEQRSGAGNKKKARGGAGRVGAAGGSRAGTATPVTAVSRAASRSGTPAVGTPGTGIPPIVPVGMPGEPGSADVPLEYSLEMEKAEQNRLTEIRVRIVEQMDRWRERLIAQERELARLKAEMK